MIADAKVRCGEAMCYFCFLVSEKYLLIHGSERDGMA